MICEINALILKCPRCQTLYTHKNRHENIQQVFQIMIIFKLSTSIDEMWKTKTSNKQTKTTTKTKKPNKNVLQTQGRVRKEVCRRNQYLVMVK
jgi:hypothetical protein